MPAPVHDQQALKACNEDIAGKQAPSLASRSRVMGACPPIPLHAHGRRAREAAGLRRTLLRE